MGGKSSQACAATRRIMSNCTMAATRPHIFTKCSAWAWENQVRSWPGSHLSRTHADGRRKFARPAACQILNRTYQSRRLLAGPDSRNFVDLFRRIMSLGPKMAKHGREREHVVEAKTKKTSPQCLFLFRKPRVIHRRDESLQSLQHFTSTHVGGTFVPPKWDSIMLHFSD